MKYRIVAILPLLLILTACAPSPTDRTTMQMEEASTNLDLEDLRPLLKRVSDLVEEGFGEVEISGAVQVAESMELNEEMMAEFSVRFHGESKKMKIGLFMDGIEALDIYFFAPSDLSDAIGEQISLFAEEHY